MMRPLISSAAALELSRQAVFDPPDEPTDQGPEETGIGTLEDLLTWLARLRLLHGVPFPYLVPHEDLLPPESIRFFYLDRNWTDALVEGALAAGGSTNGDHAQIQGRYEALRDAIDETERGLWVRFAGGEQRTGEAEIATGFLLRSRAVSGWPGLHVRGYDADDKDIRILRLERLAPPVLFMLFDGVPRRMEIEEPKQGIQFGVDPELDGSFCVKVRDPVSGEVIERQVDGELKDLEVPVPFRAGSPGVIAVNRLRKDLLEAAPTELAPEGMGPGGDDELSSAEYALQVLQYPFLQSFGERPVEPEDVAVFTLPLKFVIASYEGRI